MKKNIKKFTNLLNMKNKVTDYVVFDKKDRWMGGYSVELNVAPLSHVTSAKEMAIINAQQCNGRVFEVYSAGNMKQIYPEKSP